jgi:ATPase subunit of ABC transporter with duplicated ATPase domains
MRPGLQFSEAMQAMSTESLSGGWLMRVALASALFIEPDILMLDEPTNHLDLEAVLWLQDYLIGYPHTVIVVSHDRAFLNGTVCFLSFYICLFTLFFPRIPNMTEN